MFFIEYYSAGSAEVIQCTNFGFILYPFIFCSTVEPHNKDTFGTICFVLPGQNGQPLYRGLFCSTFDVGRFVLFQSVLIGGFYPSLLMEVDNVATTIIHVQLHKVAVISGYFQGLYISRMSSHFQFHEI